MDANTFYHLRESGGTRISSAYQLCQDIVQKEYDPEEWNLYAFHFSDGENFGDDDNQRCLELLSENLLPASNLFCYGQVMTSYGKPFIKTLEEIDDEKLATAKIESDDDIYNAIKSFLGKGF